MTPQDDPTISSIRETRHIISEECGHDPQTLVNHYLKLQEQHQKSLLKIAGRESRQNTSKRLAMSLDYPEYEKIRERSRKLGWLWQLGDKSYYLGLLGGLIFPLASTGKWMLGQIRVSTRQFVWSMTVVTLCCWLLVFFSSVLKGYVHRRAKERWPEIYL